MKKTKTKTNFNHRGVISHSQQTRRISVQGGEENQTDGVWTFEEAEILRQGNHTPSLTSPADTYVIEIPENSALMRGFERHHPHLCHWYHTKLGIKYLEQQRGER